jgi:hypothetical protein
MVRNGLKGVPFFVNAGLIGSANGSSWFGMVQKAFLFFVNAGLIGSANRSSWFGMVQIGSANGSLYLSY